MKAKEAMSKIEILFNKLRRLEAEERELNARIFAGRMPAGAGGRHVKDLDAQIERLMREIAKEAASYGHK